MAQQKKRIEIPQGLSRLQREELAELIREFIVERTQSGRGADGQKFHRYSKEYAKVKGRSSPVDLKESGDMLDDLSVLTTRSGSVTIGYENGTFSNDKAEGNQKVNGREFIGVSGRALSAILREFKSRIDEDDSAA